jgi:putative selenate reductase FAD-binding subunit
MVEQFHKPATVQEALNLKKRLRDRAEFLAGGTMANAMDCPLHPEHWISLASLKLDRIELKRGELIIGACCTLQQVIDDARTPEPLRAATAQIVSRNVRNMATVGGHVAANLPHSDLIPMLLALDAKVVLPGPRTVKTVSVLEFLAVGDPHGVLSGVTARTKSGQSRLITKVIIPRADRHRLAACAHVRASANARSLLSAAVSLTLTDLGVQDPIIALGGIARHVGRLSAAEMALEGKPLPPIDQLEAMIRRSVGPRSTPFASAPYIQHQAGVVVALAIQKALRPEGGRE